MTNSESAENLGIGFGKINNLQKQIDIWMFLTNEINVEWMLKMIQLYPVFVFVILPVASFMFLFTMLGKYFR